MVALAHPESPRRHLRLVTAEEFDRRRRAELAVMRRRALVVGVVVALLLALGLLLGRGGGQPSALPAHGTSDAVLPVADRAYVVQPGDTLWQIARALQPDGDVRPLVAQLQRARHGAPLRVGERITLP
jgi:nucleoid-associated protein YgaU